jgi:alpha-1,3-glucan synthase
VSAPDYRSDGSHLSTPAPLVNETLDEYDFSWKKSKAILDYAPWGLSEYRDFSWSNEMDDTCRMPTFWNSNGTVLEQTNVVNHVGCKAADFDGYGDMEA